MRDVNETAFEVAYGRLNQEQKIAVDTIEGPVLVVAGPGTGKTQILTLRIANILLKTDTAPEQILAITFTESGVKAMRHRLVSFIGPLAYRVPIHTFHSLAGRLIAEYPTAYETVVGGRPASDLEKFNLIEAILSDPAYKALRPHGDPIYYIKPIIDALSTLKKEYISPDDLAAAIKKQEAALLLIPKLHEKGAHRGKVRGEYLEAEKLLKRNLELLSVYRSYQAGLKAKKLYDYEDMILDTIKALKVNEDMLRDQQERYLYILADEHQDVNQSQNALIELIAGFHERPNVFVVGDEKQAIYRFQGASLDNFLYFEDRFPNAKVISLVENYRSVQPILDGAQALIETDDPRLLALRVPLKANNRGEAEMSCGVFSNTAVENSWLVDNILERIASGVREDEIAIIVRTNREVEELTRLLRKKQVAVNPSAESDVLEHPIMRQVLLLLAAYCDFSNEAVLAELIHAPYWQIPLADRAKLLKARSYEETLSSLLTDSEQLTKIGITAVAAVTKISDCLRSARELSFSSSPSVTLEYIFTKSGLIDYVMKVEPVFGAPLLRRVYQEIDNLFIGGEAQNLDEVYQQLVLLKQHRLPLKAPAVMATRTGVSVMTAHKAKGLEFSAVFLPHLTDSLWGGATRSDLFALPVVKHQDNKKELSLDDERRLLYVALTRAKNTLIITYSNTNQEGKEQLPSRLLLPLQSSFPALDLRGYEDGFDSLSGLEYVETREPPVTTELLQATLRDNGWSATSFNNYKQSPWQYIYRNVLRFPAVKTPELQFGSIMHAILDLAGRREQKKSAVTTTWFSEQLSYELKKLPLTAADLARLHERALRSLVIYWERLQASVILDLAKTEYQLTATLPTNIKDFPEVKLRGNLDRVDFSSQGEIARVVDYKTGKPKTRGEIEGKTKNSTGNYKRQLIFYALLLSLQPDSRHHAKVGTLSFIEPDAKGQMREETFTITETEINALKEEIVAATQAVVSGDCLKQTCDPNQCDYCHLLVP